MPPPQTNKKTKTKKEEEEEDEKLALQNLGYNDAVSQAMCAQCFLTTLPFSSPTSLSFNISE